ncbi:hypothetical protein M0R45_037451 [Rubus argutus]|uniref:Uncharacterized protein n=1 Tax=Rubus argutus TaxID=59490 RepID=A0AAW1W2V0_RUBAR
MALQWLLLLSVICSTLLLVDVTHSSAQGVRKAYIVYMGDKPKNEVPLSPLHLNMLQDVVDSSNIDDIEHEALLLHSYKRSFNGFAAMLTEQEEQKMAGMDGVVSVFPSKQKSDSFSDVGFGPPPKKWKGKCQGNGNFTCNNKIIGAQYYRASRSFEDEIESPRDIAGHGTHCASTAAGNLVNDDALGPLSVPASQVGLEENSNIYKYIKSTRNPTATIWKSEEVNDVLAPYVPYYSSRGPNPAIPNVLKPDLAAPGSYILAAYSPSDGGKLAGYNFDTGTSMACPHATL